MFVLCNQLPKSYFYIFNSLPVSNCSYLTRYFLQKKFSHIITVSNKKIHSILDFTRHFNSEHFLLPLTSFYRV